MLNNKLIFIIFNNNVGLFRLCR